MTSSTSLTLKIGIKCGRKPISYFFISNSRSSANIVCATIYILSLTHATQFLCKLLSSTVISVIIITSLLLKKQTCPPVYAKNSENCAVNLSWFIQPLENWSSTHRFLSCLPLAPDTDLGGTCSFPLVVTIGKVDSTYIVGVSFGRRCEMWNTSCSLLSADNSNLYETSPTFCSTLLGLYYL